MHESALQTPLLEQLGGQVHRVALADAAKVDAHAVPRRVHLVRLRVELEGRQPAADGDVEGAVGQGVDVLGDDQALEGRLATRVRSPEARWLMRVMSLLCRKRLNSPPRRLTRAKAACAASAA